MRDDRSEESRVRPAEQRRAGRGLRRLLLFGLLPVGLLLAVLVLLAFLFQGRQFHLASVDAEIRDTLQQAVGDAYQVTTGSSGLALTSGFLLALESRQVTITDSRSGAEALFFERVDVGLDLFSLLRGGPQFDRLEIRNGRADAGVLAGEGGAVPVSPFAALEQLAHALMTVEETFSGGAIEEVAISGFTVTAPQWSPVGEAPIVIRDGTLAQSDGRLLLRAEVEAADEGFQFNAEWRNDADGGRQLSAGIGELPLHWWLKPEQDAAGEGMSVDLKFRADVRLPFDAAMRAQSPFVKIQAGNGEIAFSADERYAIPFAVANLGLERESGDLTIENTELSIAGGRYELSGIVEGLFGVAAAGGEHAARLSVGRVIEAQHAGEESGERVTIDLAGQIDLDAIRARFGAVEVTSGADRFSGTLEAGLAEGVRLTLGSASTDMATVLALWPEIIAGPARAWVGEHVTAGDIGNLKLAVDFAADRLGGIDAAAPLRDGELDLAADFSGVTVDYRAGLAPVRNASGRISIRGNRMELALDKATMGVASAGTVALSGGVMTIDPMLSKRPFAEISVRASGEAPAAAALANQDPILALKPLGLAPGDLPGKADLKVTLAVPLEPGEGKLDWGVAGKLSGIEPKKKLFERAISRADIDLEAGPSKVSASGKARVDGFDTTFDVVEPLGGDGGRKRDIRVSATTAGLAKQGIDLAPVLDGPLVVRILTEGAGPDRYEIDLTHTAISLPWIGWSKAARTATPASIAFAMSEKGGVTTLGDLAFRMEGGRKADGTVSFGDSGLVRADLADISLNPGDRFNVNVSRKGRGYQIEASGQSFDSRPVLQMILHGEGLSSSGGGGTDVSLSANFGRLSGFNDQVMENAVLRYESGGGHLNLLDARGAINGQLSRVQATRQGDTTSFSFTSDDAGAMIAIAGFYDKMSGGKLSARLNRTGEGPFIGKVAIKDFTVVGEERLAALTAAPAPERFLRASGRLKELDLRKVRFDDLKSDIVKSENRLELQSGWLRNGQIGLTFDGIAFDESDQMNLKGTFMPFFIISRVIGEIPIIGDILSNGKNSGLIGITYRLRGAANNPGIAVNPLSVVAPGIFREIFEFKN